MPSQQRKVNKGMQLSIFWRSIGGGILPLYWLTQAVIVLVMISNCMVFRARVHWFFSVVFFGFHCLLPVTLAPILGTLNYSWDLDLRLRSSEYPVAILGSISSCYLLVSYSAYSLLVFEFRQSSRFLFAMSSSRAQLFHAVFKFVLVFVRIFGPRLLVLRLCFQFVLSTVAICIQAHWLPFNRLGPNIWALFVYTYMLLLSVSTAVQLSLAASLSQGALIGLSFGLLFASLLLSCGTYAARIWLAKHRLRFSPCPTPVSADILARHYLAARRVPDPVGLARDIYLSAASQFSSSSFLLVRYSAFLYDVEGNAPLSLAMAQRASHLRAFTDSCFILYCLERLRQEKQLALGEHTVALDRALSTLRRLEMKARLDTLAFWAVLIRAEDAEVSVLASIITRVERCKRRTERMYRDLLHDTNSFPPVLEAYARFLADIKHDTDAALAAHIQAQTSLATEPEGEPPPLPSLDGPITAATTPVRRRANSSPSSVSMVAVTSPPLPGPVDQDLELQAGGGSPTPTPIPTLAPTLRRRGLSAVSVMNGPLAGDARAGMGAEAVRSRSLSQSVVVVEEPCTHSLHSCSASVAASTRRDAIDFPRDVVLANGAAGTNRSLSTSEYERMLNDGVPLHERAHRRLFSQRLSRRNWRLFALMQVVLQLCFILAIAAVVVEYVLARGVVRDFEQDIRSMTNPSQGRSMLICGAWSARNLQISAIGKLLPTLYPNSIPVSLDALAPIAVTGSSTNSGRNGSTGFVGWMESFREQLSGCMHGLDRSVHHQYYHRRQQSASVAWRWQQLISVNEIADSSLSDTPPILQYFDTMSVLHAVEATSAAGKAVAQYDETRLVNATNDSQFFFLLYNSHRGVLDGYKFVLAGYQEALLGRLQRFQRLAVGIYIGVAALIVLLFAAVFTPVLLAISARRRGLLALFLQVPKFTVQQVRDSLKTSIKDSLAANHTADPDPPHDHASLTREDEAAYQQLYMRPQLSNLDSHPVRPVLLRVAFCFFLVLVLLSAMFACSLVFVRVGMVSGTLALSTFGLHYQVLEIAYLAQEMVYADPFIWPGGTQQISDSLGYTLSGLADSIDILRTGQHSERSIDACLDSGLVSLMREATRLRHSPLLEYAQRVIVLQQALLTTITQLVHTLNQDALRSAANIETILSVIFGLALPAIIAADCLIAVPGVVTFFRDFNGDIAMFLMIPFSVVNEVPSMRSFFKLGDEPRLDLAAILAQSQEQTRSILEAAMDAVIVTTDHALIQIANAAAERMFSYAPHDLVGKSIAALLPWLHDPVSLADVDPMVSRTHQARRADGSSFPAVVSLGRGLIDGETSFYVFTIRDMTDRERIDQALRAEKARSDELLTHVLPADIAKRLRMGESPIADALDDVSLMFADLVGFTELSSTMSPLETLDLLADVFGTFETISDRYAVEKVKTIGDAVFYLTMQHPEHIIDFALDAIAALAKLNHKWTIPLRARVGINTGSVVAGVIASKKLAWDVWGDAVNLASRMESTGVAGRVHISQHTYERVKYKFLCEPRVVEVKGKGQLNTYLVVKRLPRLPFPNDRRPSLPPPPNP